MCRFVVEQRQGRRKMDAKRILVVDDEKGICENVQKILAKNNYEVTQALSAKEALEMMAKESFSLLISDIVMPEKNGLELLKLVKEQWPLTKVIIMTAYASVDTAMKAVRLGALDYIPKPFTPKEIRETVDKAFSGKLTEAPVSEKERKAINVIDLDIPFDRREVAKYAGDEYADRLGPSDMPVVEMPSLETLEYYCKVGQKVCDIFRKLGNTCKAGLKTSECPQAKKGAKSKKAAQERALDAGKLVGIDQPFSYEEVASVTGPEYLMNLQRDGMAFVPYEKLRASMASAIAKPKKVIDVDIPFEREEVAKQTGEAYVDSLGPSDMPAVSAPSPETLEYYCKVGRKVCDIYKKLGSTCKAGLKSAECPQMKGKKKAGAAKRETPDVRKLIAPQIPFNYEEVVAVTGTDFLRYLEHDGVALMPYEELKERVAKLQAKESPRKAAVHELPRPAAGSDVLAIDDEAAVNNNIRKILSKKGLSVDQAMTKDEALKKIETKTYKLVLLDLKIPGVQGLELLQAIREKSPETLVIIITGYASIETAKESARLGAVDYLPKPFTPDEIRQVTENALRLAA
jgi:DNA-binding response OmpR family regulator